MTSSVGRPLSERTLSLRVIRVRRPADLPEPRLNEAARWRTLRVLALPAREDVQDELPILFPMGREDAFVEDGAN